MYCTWPTLVKKKQIRAKPKQTKKKCCFVKKIKPKQTKCLWYVYYSYVIIRVIKGFIISLFRYIQNVKTLRAVKMEGKNFDDSCEISDVEDELK